MSDRVANGMIVFTILLMIAWLIGILGVYAPRVEATCRDKSGHVVWTHYAGPLGLSYLCVDADGRIIP